MSKNDYQTHYVQRPFRFTKELAMKLKEAAKKKTWTQSMVVRQALEEYLKKLG